MKQILRKICNLIVYHKWTDCTHKELEPSGMMGGWRCKNCKAPVRD